MLALVAAGVVGFWACAAIGGSRQPGYDPSIDYLSALAAFGAVDPGWGVAMFGCGAVAIAAAAVLLRRVQLVLACVLLAGSACAVVVAGLARVDCPEGAAGCNAGPAVLEPTTTGAVHAGAVGAYQVLFSLALLAAAVGCRGRRRSLMVLGVVGALLTVLLAFDPLPLSAGWSQRLWVAVGHAALLAVAVDAQRWRRGPTPPA